MRRLRRDSPNNMLSYIPLSIIALIPVCMIIRKCREKIIKYERCGDKHTDNLRNGMDHEEAWKNYINCIK